MLAVQGFSQDFHKKMTDRCIPGPQQRAFRVWLPALLLSAKAAHSGLWPVGINVRSNAGHFDCGSVSGKDDGISLITHKAMHKERGRGKRRKGMEMGLKPEQWQQSEDGS